MADDPKTGRDKPDFPSSLSGIFLGLAKGAISVFSSTPAVTRLDVIKASPAWNDAQALQRKRDFIENQSLKAVPPKQLDNAIRGRNKLLGQLDDRLEILRARSPGQVDTGEQSSSVFGDSEVSPVFRQPGSFGIGPAIFGVGGMSDAEKELRDAARAASKKYAAAVKRGRKISPVARRLPPLPKTSLEKAVSAGLKVLEKVPKALLPDAELVGLAKTIGKALRGGFGPLAAQVVGTIAIEKAAAVLARRQFEQMTKILGPQDAAAVAARQMANKGPTTRRAGKSTLPPEPPRPKPPGNTGSPNQHPGVSAKPPKVIPAPPAPVLSKPQVINRPIPTSSGVKLGVPPPRTLPLFRGPLGKLLLEIKRFEDFRKLAKPYYDVFKSRTTNPPKLKFADTPITQTRTQPGSSFFAQPPSTGTASGCYTVCRKKSTGTKKRRKPRVCITPAKAARLGII